MSYKNFLVKCLSFCKKHLIFEIDFGLTGAVLLGFEPKILENP